MSSTMHVVALIEQKTRQNGSDVGIGKYRCEENQFGTFRFKVSPSTRLTKYCQPFSEGDVVILVGKFAYETVEKVEGFTINVTVATPYPKPSSGCWETEEIPLSSPYLSFNTQPISGSLRQIENCQFIRTKSIIDCNFTRRSTDIRFRIGYQTDNERFENLASIWDAYSQFFISGFFLHADNCELHIEASEVDCDLTTKKSNKIQTSPTGGYPVSSATSPLAKNLSKLLEQERNSSVITMPRIPLEQHPFVRPSNMRNSNSTNLPNSQFTPPPVQDANSQDSLHQDFYKGLHAYQQIIQRFNKNPNPSSSSSSPSPHLQLPPPPQIFSPMGYGNHQISPYLEQPQPSAEQIAELIGDQGMHQDNNGAINSKIPAINVWQLPQQQELVHHQQQQQQQQQQMENERNQVLTRQKTRDNNNLTSMQTIQHLSHEQQPPPQLNPQQQQSSNNQENENSQNQQQQQQRSSSRRKDKTKALTSSKITLSPKASTSKITLSPKPSTSKITLSLNDHEKTTAATTTTTTTTTTPPPAQQEVSTPQDSESGESQDLQHNNNNNNNNNKRTKNKKNTNDEKSRALQSVSRATLGNKFLFWEPKAQDNKDNNNNNSNDANNASGGGSSNAGSSGGMTNVITSNSPKRGRRGKSELVATNPRPPKKSRNSKKTNIEEEEVTPKEVKDVGGGDTESSDAVTTSLPTEIGSFEIQK